MYIILMLHKVQNYIYMYAFIYNDAILYILHPDLETAILSDTQCKLYIKLKNGKVL